MKTYTIPSMYAIFVVHCWVNMKPLNRTQLTNLQLYSNQSTNHDSWFGVRGPPKILLPWVPTFVDRSLWEPWFSVSKIHQLDIENLNTFVTVVISLVPSFGILLLPNNILMMNFCFYGVETYETLHKFLWKYRYFKSI